MAAIAPWLLAGLIVWLIIAAIYMYVDGFEAEAHDIVWWPLTLLKFLVRTFWRALTTGWRP